MKRDWGLDKGYWWLEDRARARLTLARSCLRRGGHVFVAMAAFSSSLDPAFFLPVRLDAETDEDGVRDQAALAS